MEAPLPHAIAAGAFAGHVVSGMGSTAAVFHGVDWLARPLNAARFTRVRGLPEIYVFGLASWTQDLLQRGAGRFGFWRLNGAVDLPEPWATATSRARNASVAYQVETEAGSELWVVKDPQFRLVECAACTSERVKLPKYPLGDARALLRKTLVTTIQFCAEENMRDWEHSYEGVLRFLEGKVAPRPFDDIPFEEIVGEETLSAEARNLLGAVFRAWPGREPGGWMTLDMENPRYASVTRRLRQALDTALMASLNERSH
jgi:hypothetical protein